MANYNSPIVYIRGFSAPRGEVDYRNYIRNMLVHFNRDYDRRRRQDTVHFPQPEIRPLEVELTEFYAADNAKEHNTDQFEVVHDTPATPVLRRGQYFYMAVRFQREIDSVQDIVRLVFSFGPRPAANKGTKAIIPVTEQEELTSDPGKWDARIHQKDEATLTLQVKIPATAPVGIWKLNIETSSSQGGGAKNFKCKEDIYVLFNPWTKEDGVYLDDEALRQEYVLNDTGKVWMGSYLKPKGRRWIFGQFDDVVLPATMYLLEQSWLHHSERGNPIQVARAISAVINSNDDRGLIQGRWDGDYKDGVPPFSWTGTVAIMEKYLKSGGIPVKYGQCWVFSGATVTVCRALGIPSRAVTNYVSAHDTNRSLTLDKYFTVDGEEIVGGPDGDTFDSCWNFHVWTDVWMSRPDLPPGYGGWQIIDATPQETSESMFRCGPASVEAVRKGEVGFSYDTPFAFSEVNADICHFQENQASSWGFSRLKMNQYHVGKRIVTKRPDVDDDDEDNNADMEDVTYQYKNPEGSQAERLAVFNAVRGVEKAQLHYEIPQDVDEDVVFDLMEIDTIPFGESFTVTVLVRNTADEERTITAVLSASSVFYTGATAHRLKKAQGEFVVQPNSSETLQIHVSPNDYIHKLVDHNLIKIYSIANVKETKQTWSEEDDFPFLKPSLKIEVSGELRVGQECTANFSFQNPLDMVLTDCTFSVEGPGLQRPKLVRHRDIQPLENVTFTEVFYPKKHGERKIMGTFNTKPLSGITGSTSVQVEN